MKISSIHTKDDEQIILGKFTVLVGPNNVGKSQTLRDIQTKMDGGPGNRTTLITDIELEKPTTFESILDGLTVVEDSVNIGQHIVRGIRSNLQAGDQVQVNLESLKTQYNDSPDMRFMLGALARYRVSFLDASSRLAVAQTTSSFNPADQPPANLLQGLFVADEKVEQDLRMAFKNAFGMDIQLDYSAMVQLTLRVAKEFGEIPQDPRKAFPILNGYNKLDTQGDGFRSFVGVVLSLLLSKGRIILLDEPEAFLHPAQARALGRWVAAHSEGADSQVIIATHNASFLAGILAEKPDADIFRLNRFDDHTTYNHVPSEATKRLVSSAILSSQRVMEAFFYRGVAVCEADSDRIIYQTIATKAFGNENVLFVHAHNKQTIKDVVSLLREATIPVCAIADIDLLNSHDNLNNLLTALNPEADSTGVLTRRKEVANLIADRGEAEVLEEIKRNTAEFLSQLDAGSHNLAGARGAINRLYTESTKWSLLKMKGIFGVSAAQRPVVEQLIGALKKVGLFVVPVGQLESWLEVGTTRKNKWVVAALELLNRENPPGEGLRQFIKEILDSMAEEARTIGPEKAKSKDGALEVLDAIPDNKFGDNRN